MFELRVIVFLIYETHLVVSPYLLMTDGILDSVTCALFAICLCLGERLL
jgi:hypothetical protein